MNKPAQISKIEGDAPLEKRLSDQAKLDSFVKENRGYLVSFLLLWSAACYLLFGVVEKGETILFFSGNRTEFRNYFFTFCTYIGEGYVYVIATIVLIFVSYSKSLFISVNAIVVLAVSQVLKRYFEHERPLRYFNDLLATPDVPNYVPDVALHDGWTTSFPSGHTTSAFAFYTLLAFFIPNKFIKICCLVLAALVGLSRMYLVQHFLKDVTSGMLTGFLIALFVYWLHDRFAHKFPGKLELKKGLKV